MPQIPRRFRPEQAVLLRDGREIPADDPRTAKRRGEESWLRDQLALKVGGLVEARLVFGTADVMTPAKVFEVKRVKDYGPGARQALAYAHQTRLRPVLALFGSATHHHMRSIYLKCLDANMHLWWHLDGNWKHISDGQQIQPAEEPDHASVERQVRTFIDSPERALWTPRTDIPRHPSIAPPRPAGL